MNRRSFRLLVVPALIFSAVLPLAAQRDGSTNPRLDWWILNGKEMATAKVTPAAYTLDHLSTKVQCIDADEYGRLYVVDGTDFAIRRFNPNGKLDKEWLQGPVEQHASGIFDISVITGGRIYCSTMFSNMGAKEEIRRITPTKDQTLGPRSDLIAALEDGSFFVYEDRLRSDADGLLTLRYCAANGGIKTDFAVTPLRGMAAGPDEQLYCTDREKPIIWVYSKKGQLNREINLEGLGSQGISLGRIAVNTNGDIYVVIYGIWIVHLDSQGRFINRWNAFASKNVKPALLFFRDITVRNGIIYAYVMNLNNSWEIQAYTPGGQCIARYLVSQEAVDGYSPDPAKPAVLATNQAPRSVANTTSAKKVSSQQISSVIPSLQGVVIAGIDDFTDEIYIECQDGSWGAKANVSKEQKAKRGNIYSIEGTINQADKLMKSLSVRLSRCFGTDGYQPEPLSMANQYVGNGYIYNGKVVQPNLGLLVQTWGRVVSVDQSKNTFIIDDGSKADGKGLTVYAGNLKSPITHWPEVGSYVGITGISITVNSADGSKVPAVRIRNDADIETL